MFPNTFIGLVALLYALSNPISILPIFMGLTQKVRQDRINRLIFTTVITIAIVLGIGVVLGEQVLRFFDISIDDFRIAGGLLALYIAFVMFHAHPSGITQTAEEKADAEAEAEENIQALAVTPLAFPLLVGPAEVSIMITMANDAPDFASRIWLLLAGLCLSLLIGATLRLAVPLYKFMGRTGINIATRIMALIVASIGIHFIVSGLQNQFPGLSRL